MTTLKEILNNITGKDKFMRMILNKDHKIGNSGDHELEYNIIYTKSDGTTTIEKARIYVTDFGLSSESATWLGTAPRYVTGVVASTFEAALINLIAAMKQANKLILRINVIELCEVDTYAVVEAYLADQTKIKQVTKVLYFVWEDSGTLTYAPYEATNA